MQWRIIYNILISCNFLSYLSFALFVVQSTVAMADAGLYQSSSQYPVLNRYPELHRAENSAPVHINPWAVSAQPPSANVYSPQLSCDQPDDASSAEQSGYGQIRPGRFVTPQILESLKQQQRHYQTMPGNQYYFSQRSQQKGRERPRMEWDRQGFSNQNSYGQNTVNGSVYGAGSVNPLYEAPAVSPWGSGVDVLNHGESFPMVPSESVGGISPMYVPSYGMGNYNSTGATNGLMSNNAEVFNPFTFLPNSGIPKR